MEIPNIVRKLLNANEVVVRAHNFYDGQLVLTTDNVYCYWINETGNENVMDLPLKKIQVVIFYKPRKLGFFETLFSNKKTELQELGDQLVRIYDYNILKQGVLHIRTSWESFNIIGISEDQAREIIMHIKKLIESFYPEPLSFSETNRELYHLIRLDIPPRRHIPKRRVELKLKSSTLEPMRDIRRRLTELKILYNNGLITEDEYQRKKKELLDML